MFVGLVGFVACGGCGVGCSAVLIDFGVWWMPYLVSMVCVVACQV